MVFNVETSPISAASRMRLAITKWQFSWLLAFLVKVINIVLYLSRNGNFKGHLHLTGVIAQQFDRSGRTIWLLELFREPHNFIYIIISNSFLNCEERIKPKSPEKKILTTGLMS